MLIHHTDLDEHLDFLEEKEGHCFFLSRKEKDVPSFIETCQEEILNSEWDHTMLIVEQPTTHHKNFKLRKILKKFGAKIDGVRTHQIHAFTVPSELYRMMVREFGESNG